MTMRVECTADRPLLTTEIAAVLNSCWPDFAVASEDIWRGNDEGTLWSTPIPEPLANNIRAGEQSKWQNSATVPVGGEPVTVVLTFDPGTAVED